MKNKTCRISSSKLQEAWQELHDAFDKALDASAKLLI
jgi:hypothetical protein